MQGPWGGVVSLPSRLHVVQQGCLASPRGALDQDRSTARRQGLVGMCQISHSPPPAFDMVDLGETTNKEPGLVAIALIEEGIQTKRKS